jgi:hypothetical protein
MLVIIKEITVRTDEGKPLKDFLKNFLIESFKKTMEKYPNIPVIRMKTKEAFVKSTLSHCTFWNQLAHLESEKFIIKRHGEIIVPRENVAQYLSNDAEIGASQGVQPDSGSSG